MRRLFLILPLIGLTSACIDIPQGRKSQPVRQSTASYATSPDARQCLSQLGATQASFTPQPDKYLGPGCSTLNTVRLASLRSDQSTLSMTNLGPVTCQAATSFAGWARFGVDRAARQILGSPLARIETFGSYNCRNVAGTNRRSGHATANAIDVSGFVLANGRRISVLHDWDSGNPDVRRFLRVVQQSACKRFGMVLGPDYNKAHEDHFHLEEKPGNFCR